MSLPQKESQLIGRAFARTSFGLVHYRYCGQASSQSRPLLMLHPSPGSSKSIEPRIQAFGENHYAIAPDTPGYGDSDALPQEQPELDDFVAGLFELVDSLGIDEFDIYGFHTGSHIAIESAIRHPDRVKHIILDGVAIIAGKERQEYLEYYAPPQKKDELGAQFHWAWSYMRDQMVFAPHYRKDTAHMHGSGHFSAEKMHEMTMDLLKSLEHYHKGYNAVFRHEVSERLPLVPVPALVLTGDTSTLNKNAETVARLIPDCQLVKIPLLEDSVSARAVQIKEFLL